MAGAGAAAAQPQALALALALAPPTRTGAGAAAPRGLLELAADAALCSFMAARRACGRDSRAAAVAEELFVMALLTTGLLLQLTILTQLLLVLLRGRKEAQVPPIVGGGRGRQDALCGSVTERVFFVSFMSMMVGMLMVILAPAKESYIASVGYMVGDLGCFLHSVAFCFVVYPQFLVQLKSTYANQKEA